MSTQRYQRVNAHDDDENNHDDFEFSSTNSHSVNRIPNSPPPSFRSRSSSPTSRRLLRDDPMQNEADQALEDAFDDGNDSDNGDNEPDDRQRLMRGNPSLNDTQNISSNASSSDARQNEPQPHQRRVTAIPSFAPSTTPSGRIVGMGISNDGVFANLNAKPERGEKTEEDLPPSYEQAAADATPPYWETTIMAPGMSSDEVYIDGLPVGSIFSFVWNGMISMSFQLVGFLLTYLLHTTHAAKNGSRAGLGLTLVQYGFYMKGNSERRSDGGGEQYHPPPDPNSHDFNPNSIGDNTAAAVGGQSSGGGSVSSISTMEWISYILMIVGWFILIRSVSDFLRARRHEQLVLQSPDRGLSAPIVAEGERSETVV